MKKQIQKFTATAIRSIPALLLGILFINLPSSPTEAQSIQSSLTRPIVKYLGKIDDQPVLQVDFENKDGEIFNVMIRNQEGDVLYADKNRDKNFSKKFQVNQPEPGKMKLTLIISTDMEMQSQVLEITTNTYNTEDAVVNKL